MHNVADVQSTRNHTPVAALPQNTTNSNQFDDGSSGREQFGCVTTYERRVIRDFQYTYIDAATGETVRYKIDGDACYTLLGFLRSVMNFKTEVVKGLTQEWIAAELGWGKSKVQRATRALESMGLIKVHGCTKQVATYVIAPRPRACVISVTDDTNSQFISVPGDTNPGIISVTDDTNTPDFAQKTALLVSPVTPNIRSNNDDDGTPDRDPHRFNGALAEKAETKTTHRHRGLRTPALAAVGVPELPASWRELGLGRGVDRWAKYALSRTDLKEPWTEKNLLAAYEKSLNADNPIPYLITCLKGEIPTQPTAARPHSAGDASRNYSMEAFEDTAPRSSYQVEGYVLPPLANPKAVAA